MAATPNLSAVKEWMNGEPSAPIAWPAQDPYRHLTTAARIAYVIAHAASGAPMFSDVRHIVEHLPTHRRIPPPPQESP